MSPGWARPNSVRKATTAHRASELQISRPWEILPSARRGTDVAQDTDFSTEQEHCGIGYSAWLVRRPLRRQPLSYSIGNWDRTKGNPYLRLPRALSVAQLSLPPFWKSTQATAARQAMRCDCHTSRCLNIVQLNDADGFQLIWSISRKEKNSKIPIQSK